MLSFIYFDFFNILPIPLSFASTVFCHARWGVPVWVLVQLYLQCPVDARRCVPAVRTSAEVCGAHCLTSFWISRRVAWSGERYNIQGSTPQVLWEISSSLCTFWKILTLVSAHCERCYKYKWQGGNHTLFSSGLDESELFVFPVRFSQMALLLIQSWLDSLCIMSVCLFLCPGCIHPAKFAGDAYACQRRRGQGLPLAGQQLCQPIKNLLYELFSFSLSVFTQSLPSIASCSL